MVAQCLQIFRAKSRALRDTRKHSRTDFLTIMKGKHSVWPAVTCEHFMRARLALDHPSHSKQRGQDTARFH